LPRLRANIGSQALQIGNQRDDLLVRRDLDVVLAQPFHDLRGLLIEILYGLDVVPFGYGTPSDCIARIFAGV